MNYQYKYLSGMILGVLLLAWQGGAGAQQLQQNATEEAVEEPEELRLVFGLDQFYLKDYRPTRNGTVKLAFHMHLKLSEYANKRTLEQLEHWKHRLRNQVIISVRLAYRKDFLEPGLQQFRRIVQLRINRLLKMQLVDEVLLTEFTFTSNE
jgi:flagellar basal body-associated protein FliL